MRIIVVGAGEVGTFVAERLSRERLDVALVERDPRRAKALDSELDALVVAGSGTTPSVLQAAGVERADLLVAVTSSDEVNIVACSVAKELGVPRTVARIEHPELREPSLRRLREKAGIDLAIDPDVETADQLLETLELVGASEVAELAGGEIEVISARLSDGAPVVGRTLAQVAAAHEPEWDFLFVEVGAEGRRPVIPRGDHRLEAGELVRVFVRRKARNQVVRLLGLERRTSRKVMLLGGSRTAELVAQRLLARGASVVLVEQREERARELADRLPKALVLVGEATDVDLLQDEGIGSYDSVVALTGDDDTNVLACLWARREGVPETVAVIHRLALLPLLNDVGVGAALSPRTAFANGVLRFVRGGHAVTTFLDDEIEVLEFDVKEGSPADGRRVADLHLPGDVLVGAVVREGKASIARGRTELREADRIFVVARPHAVPALSAVFP